MKDQSKSIALLAEFEGEKIAGRTLAILSSRIDALISNAVLAERHRCNNIAVDAVGKIVGANQ